MPNTPPLQKGPDGGLYYLLANGKKHYVTGPAGEAAAQKSNPFAKMTPDQLTKAERATSGWVEATARKLEDNPNDPKARAEHQKALEQMRAVSKAYGDDQSVAELDHDIGVLRKGQSLDKMSDVGMQDDLAEAKAEKAKKQSPSTQKSPSTQAHDASKKAHEMKASGKNPIATAKAHDKAAKAHADAAKTAKTQTAANRHDYISQKMMGVSDLLWR